MMKNLMILAIMAYTAVNTYGQTGGPPPPSGCPPNTCTTQYSFTNLSTDCDYELCFYLDSVTADYYAACPISFPFGHFPDTIACISLPKNQSSPANIDITSFFCPPGKYLYLRAELKRIPGGNTNNYSIHQNFQGSDGIPSAGSEYQNPLCGGDNTLLFSDDGLVFYILETY